MTSLSLGVKADITERWSAALLVEQPWGVDVDYPAGAFAYAGTSAEVHSLGLTALARYRLGERFSLHGGLRATRFGSDVGLDGPAFAPLSGYAWSGDDDWGVGWVAGGAYEIPQIALRVALTYGSEADLELDSTESFPGAIGLPPLDGTTDVTLPQSLNLDFQTGVAADTLLYGSVRWVNWKDWTVAPPGLAAVTGGEPLVRFQADAFTYKLGLGRQFTDAISAAVEVAHETGRGEDMTALDPYDGYTAVSVGGTYAMPSGLELTGGISYGFLGDAETDVQGRARHLRRQPRGRRRAEGRLPVLTPARQVRPAASGSTSRRPPSTARTWPVMKLAAGEARNSAASAHSCGSPARPNAVTSASASGRSSIAVIAAASDRLGMPPTSTAFTRMWCGASVSASALVSRSSAAQLTE